MRKLLAALVFLASIVVAVYGTYWLIARGIHDLNYGFSAHPHQVGTIVGGVLLILIAWEGYAFAIVWIGGIIAAAIGWSPWRRRHAS